MSLLRGAHDLSCLPPVRGIPKAATGWRLRCRQGRGARIFVLYPDGIEEYTVKHRYRYLFPYDMVASNRRGTADAGTDG